MPTASVCVFAPPIRQCDVRYRGRLRPTRSLRGLACAHCAPCPFEGLLLLRPLPSLESELALLNIFRLPCTRTISSGWTEDTDVPGQAGGPKAVGQSRLVQIPRIHRALYGDRDMEKRQNNVSRFEQNPALTSPLN
jgi:hypothetical protein